MQQMAKSCISVRLLAENSAGSRLLQPAVFSLHICFGFLAGLHW